MRNIFIVIFSLLCGLSVSGQSQPPALRVNAARTGLETEDGKPFFWLGDTGWLLFVKLKREQVIAYLDTRSRQGYNVIQVMVLHDVKRAVNAYGDSALVNQDASKPNITSGSTPENAHAYDFWDHVDFVVREAAKRNLYLGLVPVWGTNVKNGWVSETQARDFATFLARRYKQNKNIIWLNGGDIKGTDGFDVWQQMGRTLDAENPTHLITFHARGRFTSSRWFHQEKWLDFNMFQSGHRNYLQDTTSGETHYGEDNWKYIEEDLALRPAKPTLDGEPSYEGIPHGLHDTTDRYWHAADIRRYAYWNTIAGGFGFTYGHNAVMQFYQPGDSNSAYGARKYWQEALNDTGARQMTHLRKLFEKGAWADRKLNQSVILNNGEKYDRVIAATGSNYLLAYTYTGKKIEIKQGSLPGTMVSFAWYDPRTGSMSTPKKIKNTGSLAFQPDGGNKEGNDWVLIVKSI